MRPSTEARRPPVPGEIATRHRVDDQSGIWGTRPAVYGRARSTIDWTLVGDLSDWGGIRFSARDISLVFRSVDAEDVYETVTARRWGEGEDGGQEG